MKDGDLFGEIISDIIWSMLVSVYGFLMFMESLLESREFIDIKSGDYDG